MVEKNIETRTERKMKEVMHDIVEYGIKVKFTKKTIVDTAELIEYFDQIRDCIREDLQEALEIKQMRHQILEEAQNEADLLVERAREELEKQDILQQAMEYAHNLSREAQEEKDMVIAEGMDTKQQLIQEGYAYLDHCMSEVEKHVETAEAELRKDREVLQENRRKLQAQIKEELAKSRDILEKDAHARRFA